MSSQPLRLNAFRGEPASSGFEWHFTPNHNSSADSSLSKKKNSHSTPQIVNTDSVLLYLKLRLRRAPLKYKSIIINNVGKGKKKEKKGEIEWLQIKISHSTPQIVNTNSFVTLNSFSGWKCGLLLIQNPNLVLGLVTFLDLGGQIPEIPIGCDSTFSNPCQNI